MKFKYFDYFIILILATGCSRLSPTPSPVFATHAAHTELPSETIFPTVTLMIPTNTFSTILSMVESPNISFDEYNSISAHANVFPSQYLAMSPDGQVLASLGYAKSFQRNIEGLVYFWNISNLDYSIKAFQSLVVHPESITFSNSGNLIAIGGCGQEIPCVRSKISVFEWKTGIVTCSLEYSGHGIDQIEFTKDDSNLIVQDVNNRLSIWDLGKGQIIKTIESLSSGANSFALSPQGDFIAIYTLNGVQLLNTNTLDPIETKSSPNVGYGSGLSIAISPYKKWLAAGGCGNISSESCLSGEIYLWNFDNSEPVHILSGHGASVFSLKFSFKEDLLASGSYDGLIFWDPVTGERVPSPYSYQGIHVYDIVFPQTQNLFVVFSNVGIVLGEISSDHLSWAYTTLDRFGVGRKYLLTMAGSNQDLHESPSLNSPVLTELQAGEKVTIIEGPEFADGYTWWWLKTDNELSGWAVENPDWYIPIP